MNRDSSRLRIYQLDFRIFVSVFLFFYVWKVESPAPSKKKKEIKEIESIDSPPFIYPQPIFHKDSYDNV